MENIAQILQSARMERGISLADISARTKIDEKYLRAIEAGDRNSLPGRFFWKSFVHQYAEYLGLDTKAIDAEVDRSLRTEDVIPFAEVSEYEEATEEKPFEARRGLSPLAYAALGMVVVTGLGTDAWLHRSRSSKPAQPVAVSQPAQESPATTVTEPKAATVAEEKHVTPAPSAGKVELALTATEATWLSVTSDGTPVFSGILQPNQTKTIEGKETANLRVGNAAGLEVRLNGTPIGSLGARGQVRDLSFTSDKFRFVSQANQTD
jgi:cytoskeleton protein RodZ